MRAKPTTNSKSNKTSKGNNKSISKGIVKKTSKGNVKKAKPDLSILRPPVDTSICGLKQAVKVFETGTPEMLQLLTYDCDVVYECKVCRNLFRSIANFISHKRVYCTLRYSRAQELSSNKQGENALSVLEEKAQERLPARITARKDLTSILQTLTAQNPLSSAAVHLEPMENTSFGVFQTVLKPNADSLMRNQVSELEKLQSKSEVVLGPDGKVLQNGLSDLNHVGEEPSKNNLLKCPYCDVHLSTQQSLLRHTRNLHQEENSNPKLIYKCPYCKNCYAKPYSVCRHLCKVHKKTSEQVRKLRAQIYKKALKVEKSISNQNKQTTSPNKRKNEMELQNTTPKKNKECINNFEDDLELQRCGGCGRKFERKVALISHAQVCHKRIMAYNNRIVGHNFKDSLPTNLTPVVAISPLQCSKMPIPKPSPEKKIGIQVRMNYCKNSSQLSDRQQACSRSVMGDESDIEACSVDGRESYSQKGSDLDQFLKNTNSCQSSDRLEKVQSYLNTSVNIVNKELPYEVPSTRSTITKTIGKSKSIEEKCLQLRSALEHVDNCGIETKVKEENWNYSDGHVDNGSESNTSAVSSLSCELTPLTDSATGYGDEREEKIKNLTSIVKIEPTISSTDSIKAPEDMDTHSPDSKIYDEGVSLSVTSEEAQRDSAMTIDTSIIKDEEISVVSECINTCITLAEPIRAETNNTNKEDSIPILTRNQLKVPNNIDEEIELENSIPILTRNQLKVLCKNDPISDCKKPQKNSVKRPHYKLEVESAFKALKEKMSMYIDEKLNRCNICKKKFKSISRIYSHIASHTQWKRYECLFSGCNFQTFYKSTCLEHVNRHPKHSNGDSLVGQIKPSRWNIELTNVKNLSTPTPSTPNPSTPTPSTPKISKKLVDRPPICTKDVTNTKKIVKKIASEKVAKGFVSKKVKKTIASKKIIISVSGLTKKTKITESLNKKPNLKETSHLVTKKPFVDNMKGKQKLLTEFKEFNSTNKGNVKQNMHTKINNPNKVKSQKVKQILIGCVKNLKIETIPNGNSIHEEDLEVTEIPAGKKQKCDTSFDDSRVNLTVVKEERADSPIVISHTFDNNGNRRASRSTSRKTSINSLDQHRENLVSLVDDSVGTCKTIQDATNTDCQKTNHLSSCVIVDCPDSLEEDESQESNKFNDDTHLTKMIQEVIFGPRAKATQAMGRPVRNRFRPKRDNDFVIGSEKETEKESTEGKPNLSRKSTKSACEIKSVTDLSKKSKKITE